MVETDLEVSCRTYIWTLSEPEELMKGVRVKIGSATEIAEAYVAWIISENKSWATGFCWSGLSYLGIISSSRK